MSKSILSASELVFQDSNNADLVKITASADNLALNDASITGVTVDESDNTSVINKVFVYTKRNKVFHTKDNVFVIC